MQPNIWRVSAAVALLVFAWPCLASAADCVTEVQAAFEKQRTRPSYRVLTKQPSPNGEVTTTTEFQQPDRMHNKVEVPGEPGALETVAIGRWAWASHGFGFQELQPQFAQTVTFDVVTKLATPVKVTGPFTCLGTLKRDGRDLTAYQNEPRLAEPKPAGPDNPMIVRTVYLDPATGLPALETLSEAKPDSPPIISVSYSYPADIDIQAPPAVPAGRVH